MKQKYLLSALLFSSVLYGQVRSNYLLPLKSSINNYITNSNECISVVLEGSNNKILIDLNPVTDLLKIVVAELKKSNARLTKPLQLAENKLPSISDKKGSQNMATAQYNVAKSLDSLAEIYLDSTQKAIVKPKLLSVKATSGPLICHEDLETVILNGVTYFLTAKPTISTNELTLFETTNKNNRLLFKFKNKFGFLDTLGEIAIAAQYDSAYSFSEGLTFVRRNKIGDYFIDVNDSIILDLGTSHPYKEIYSFHNNIARVFFKLNGDPFQKRYNYINRHGKLIADSNFWRAYDFTFGLGCISMFENLHNITDSLTSYKAENWLYHPYVHHEKKLVYISNLYDNTRKVVEEIGNDEQTKTLKLYFEMVKRAMGIVENLNKDINERVRFKKIWKAEPPVNLTELLSYALKLNLNKPLYEVTQSFIEIKKNWTFIDRLLKQAPRFGYIDSSGKIQISCSYFIAMPFDNFNTARVTINASPALLTTKSFLIDRAGHEKGNGSYNYYVIRDEVFDHPVNPFEGRYSYTATSTIDTAGRRYYEADDNEITDLNDNLIVCQNKNGFQGLRTVSGLEILPFEFSQITLQEKNIWLTQKDKEYAFYYVNPAGKAIKVETSKPNR